MSLERFFKHKTSDFVFGKSKFTSEHDWIYIPYGHHELKNLLKFINKYLCKVNCGVERVMGQKCVIVCNKNISMYSSAPLSFDNYQNNVYMEKLTNRFNDKDQYDLKIEITFLQDWCMFWVSQMISSHLHLIIQIQLHLIFWNLRGCM